MSKLIQITLLLIAFAAQSVTAASVHCAMDMGTDLGTQLDNAMTDSNGPEHQAEADMHTKMGHAQMDHSMHSNFDTQQNDSSEQLDCCESLSDCPMGTCSSPALNHIAELNLINNIFHLVVSESEKQTQSATTNLYRPPILA